MSNIPSELKYLSTHEWICVEDGVGIVGITDHAQESMGDLVFVEMPEVGTVLTAGEEAGVVESVKAASDIFAPVSGEVLEVNNSLEEAPEAVNQDAYGIGWMFKIKLADEGELSELLTAEDYQAQLDESNG